MVTVVPWGRDLARPSEASEERRDLGVVGDGGGWAEAVAARPVAWL